MDDTENKVQFVLTQHVKERYAERIKGKDDRSTAAVYAAQNEEKILSDITKMLEYGKIVYTGRSFAKDNNKPCHVYLCHLWIICVDKDTNTVITMYPIDLGLGEKFNKDYVELLEKKIAEETEAWEREKEAAAKDIETYKELIDANESTIKDYRKTLKSLEEQNEEYVKLKALANTRVEVAENVVRGTIGKLLGKKGF